MGGPWMVKIKLMAILFYGFHSHILGDLRQYWVAETCRICANNKLLRYCRSNILKNKLTWQAMKQSTEPLNHLFILKTSIDSTYCRSECIHINGQRHRPTDTYQLHQHHTVWDNSERALIKARNLFFPYWYWGDVFVQVNKFSQSSSSAMKSLIGMGLALVESSKYY